MYECGKLKKVIGNKFLFPVILEQLNGFLPWWTLATCLFMLHFLEHLYSQMSHLNGLHLVSIGTIVSFLWTIFKCISYTIFLSNWSLHCSQNRSLIVLDSRWVEKLLDSVDDSNSFFIKGSSLIWISSCKWFTGDFGNIFMIEFWAIVGFKPGFSRHWQTKLPSNYYWWRNQIFWTIIFGQLFCFCFVQYFKVPCTNYLLQLWQQVVTPIFFSNATS